jgi:hypothetical protein
MQKSDRDMYKMIGMRFPLFIAGKNTIVQITKSEKQHDKIE